MFAAALSAVLSPTASLAIDGEWAAYKLSFKKGYHPSEESRRFANFKVSHDFVEAHNADPSNSWTAGLNDFSDLTWEEFKAQRLMTPQVHAQPHPTVALHPHALSSLPFGCTPTTELQRHAYQHALGGPAWCQDPRRDRLAQVPEG
jgi:hypothetical protein